MSLPESASINTGKSAGPFPVSAFAYLAAAEDRHWWFRARNRILIWVLQTKTQRVHSFLEVGCGTGYVIKGISKAFPNLNLEATEYFADGMQYARQRVPTCHFKQLDATRMHDVDVYDCIGSFDVIEHIEADDIVLGNFYRALRSQGHLLLTVPQHAWLWSAADDFAHHVRRYERSDLRRRLRMKGFQICYCTSFVSILLPLMAIQRLVSSRADYDPDEEFKVSPLMNGVLYLIMRLEIILLQIGLRFPFGGSLLVLARKP